MPNFPTSCSATSPSEPTITFPRVSIGLPVFNGERFVRQAIESVLNQSWTDFELIISDNASTDLTDKICVGYACSDDRVRYVRQRENIGAGQNFNVVLDLAKGEYFKWMAHDDVIDQTFIENCLNVLDKDDSYVLVSTRVQICNADLSPLLNYEYDLNADSRSVSNRFRQQMRGHQCYEIFGLIRRAALQLTPGMGNFFAGDAALLLRLVLLGRFCEIPDHLFYSRQHESQSEKLRGRWQAYMSWFDPKHADKITLPYWRLLVEYISIVRQSDLRTGERLRCAMSLLVWTARRWKHLGRDALVATLQIAERFTKRLAKAVSWSASHWRT